MIIDRVRLSGGAAYLTDQGALDLANSANNRGVSRPVPDGLGIETTGVHLLLRAEDLLKLYARTEVGQGPLLTLSLKKEMFPGLFADPYANRVHTISGFDDFQRGAAEQIRAMEVEGQATLVSTGFGSCSWQSAVYHLPEPSPIEAAAWDLASSRLAPSDTFYYELALLSWTSGQDPAVQQPTVTPLAAGSATPQDVRFLTGLGLADIAAYRLRLKADVRHDAYLLEYQLGSDDTKSLGRPLLRAVHLLEPITTMYAVNSLCELEVRCSNFSILEIEAPRRTLSAFLDLSALLLQNEEIALAVNPGVFSLCEARLEAELRVRPPVITRAMAT